MSTTWHRSEPRLVRPFFGVIQAEHAVADTHIRLFDGAMPVEDTTFDLDDFELPRLRPVILPSVVLASNWLPSGFMSHDFQLVLYASNAFLKNSRVFHSSQLDSKVSEEIEVPAEVLESLGGGRNLQLTIAVCLATDKEAGPGLPSIIGHWVARKDFILKLKSNPSMFDVRTRTDDEWKEANYPSKTLYAIDYIGGIAGDVESDAELNIATVYIHIDAYNKMTSDKVGEILQPTLSAEIIAQIVESSIDDWDNETEIPSNSPLATLLKRMSVNREVTLDDLRTMVKQRQGSRLRAILQNALGAVRAIV